MLKKAISVVQSFGAYWKQRFGKDVEVTEITAEINGKPLKGVIVICEDDSISNPTAPKKDKE